MGSNDPADDWQRPWHESSNPTRVVRGAGWRFGVGIVVVMAVVGAIGAVVWGIGVLTSGTAGKGNVIRDNNSSQNQEAAQAYFRTEYGDIQAYTVQLATAADDLKAAPSDPIARTNARGLQNTCISAVTDYNNKSKTTLYQNWKDDGLPETIDPQEACPNPFK